MRKGFTVLGALALLLTLVLLMHQGCAKQAPSVQLIQDMYSSPDSPRSAPPAGSVPYGEQPIAKHAAPELFANHCTACHGSAGDGRSYVSTYNGMPSVGNLTTNAKSATELLQSIRHGRGAMPAFLQRLNEYESALLTDYIINHIRNK